MSHVTNITDDQIRALRSEAITAADFVQRVICDVALDEVESTPDMLDEDGFPDFSGGGHSRDELTAIRRWLRAGEDAARAECARVIADADANR